jgi:hypothetical protein
MKIMRPLAGAVTTIPLIALALFLANGCGKKQGAFVQPQPGAHPSAEKNSFAEVAKHLDTGGSLYLYLGTEQWFDGLSGKVAAWRGALEGLPGNSPDAQQRVGRAFDVLTGLIKDSGIEEVSGFGMSGIAWEKDFYHTTAVLHHYPGKDSGYLWSMFGKQAHELNGLELLPATTAMASFFDMDLGMLWSAIGKEAGKLGVPELTQELQMFSDGFARATGSSLEKMLSSLGNEYGMVITLDESRMVSLPIPGVNAQVPEPGILLVIKVKNDLIFDRIDQQMQGNQQVIKTDRSDLKMRTMPVPLPLPISLRPSIARSGDYLIFASTDSLIEEALAVKSGKKAGLKSTDEFKKLSEGIPAQGNQFTFVSERFLKAYYKITDDAFNSGGMNNGQAKLMQTLMKYRSAGAAYNVAANTDEGWIGVGNGSQNPATAVVFLPAVAVGGALAAIALPNFARARATAQNNACIKNLRLIDAAKQQWALENRAASSAIPNWENIRPYLGRGPSSPIPVCPQGGTYTLNAADKNPTCSIPGHQLSH